MILKLHEIFFPGLIIERDMSFYTSTLVIIASHIFKSTFMKWTLCWDVNNAVFVHIPKASYKYKIYSKLIVQITDDLIKALWKYHTPKIYGNHTQWMHVQVLE